MLVITDRAVTFHVLQTVRRGDVTSTRVTVLAAYQDIRDLNVIKVGCKFLDKPTVKLV